jgi:hypothetical protein
VSERKKHLCGAVTVSTRLRMKKTADTPGENPIA